MDQVLEESVNRIVSYIKPEKIILFGSRARGDYNQSSDYDLCIIKDGIENPRRLAREIYKILYGVGGAIEVLVEKPENFEKHKDNPFFLYQNILKEGVLVYEKPRIS
ncbi:MAG TPA: nucleotidyltransferase domain-containing protein [Bacillota bacterium]|nr:nucleotidyltransferase domain-containing protein [Bacillota bacterium]